MKQLTPRQLVMAAGVISVLIAVMLYQYLSGMQEHEIVETENVVVAAVDIPEKTVIKPEMLKVVAMPRESVPPGSYKSTAEVQGMLTKTKIFAGDAASKSKLITDGNIPGFIGTIPDDKRAISINISDTTGVSGFAQPGDFVDIMLISDKERKNTVGGRIFLQNIQLLAINKSENSSSDGNDKSGSARKEQMATATMAVSPEDAVKLAVAQKEGELYLVLRPFKPKQGLVLSNDYRVYLSGSNASAEVSGQAAASAQPSVPARSYEPPAQAAAAQSAPAQSAVSYDSDSVSVIRGTEKTAVSIK